MSFSSGASSSGETTRPTGVRMRSYLTKAGRETLEQIRHVGQVHQNALCAALDQSERAQLAGFLTRIAAEQGLTPGVHPGFRKTGGAEC